MYSKYQQKRIARGALGFQIATDAIAQRGLSLDITRIGTARWLDMRLESMSAEEVARLVAFEEALGALIEEATTWEPGLDRAQYVSGRLDRLRDEHPMDEDASRARFNLFDSIRRADAAYGRENVEAFVREYHADKAAILGAVAARA